MITIIVGGGEAPCYQGSRLRASSLKFGELGLGLAHKKLIFLINPKQATQRLSLLGC